MVTFAATLVVFNKANEAHTVFVLFDSRNAICLLFPQQTPIARKFLVLKQHCYNGPKLLVLLNQMVA